MREDLRKIIMNDVNQRYAELRDDNERRVAGEEEFILAQLKAFFPDHDLTIEPCHTTHFDNDADRGLGCWYQPDLDMVFMVTYRPATSKPQRMLVGRGWGAKRVPINRVADLYMCKDFKREMENVK